VYRFLLKPRWILSHLFVLVCVVAMVWAGFWQLSRLSERRAANAEVLSAQNEPIAPLDELLPDGPATTPEDVAAVQYRSVTVTGTYRTDDQVLIRNRSYEGAPGYWVLTPLVLADGSAVGVNRGWVPFAVLPEGPWDRFAPPTGTVTVTGLLREPQVRATGGIVSSPEDAAEGRLRTLSRVDIGRLQQQVSTPLYPVYVDLRTQQPAQPEGTPTPVPPPELSEGPHLGYAGQWFIFATLTVVVYGLLLRRVARNKAAEARRSEDVEVGDEGVTDPVGSMAEPAPAGDGEPSRP
jgi:surfeit locus 1 family protein